MDSNGHFSGKVSAQTEKIASGKIWRQDVVTTTMQVLDILPNETLPCILIAKSLTRNGKPGRTFQQLLPVPYAALFARLNSQVGRGDTIEVTATTTWREDGYSSALTDFALTSASPLPVVETATA